MFIYHINIYYIYICIYVYMYIYVGYISDLGPVEPFMPRLKDEFTRVIDSFVQTLNALRVDLEVKTVHGTTFCVVVVFARTRTVTVTVAIVTVSTVTMSVMTCGNIALWLNFPAV